MRRYAHIAVTAFNIEMAAAVDKNRTDVTTGRWAQKRFEIFTGYCLPSLVNQGSKNFKWFVYFHADTDANIKRSVSYLQGKYDFFCPKYLPKGIDFDQGLRSDIMECIDEDMDFVITSRIDSDDCYQKNAIHRIQDCFRGQDYEAVNFCKGYRLQIKPCPALVRINWPNSPFISVIERIKPGRRLRTAYFMEHQKFKETGHVTQIIDGYYWVQIIHGNNMITSLGGGEVFLDKNVLSDFGITADKIELSRRVTVNQIVRTRFLYCIHRIIDIIRQHVIRVIPQDIRKALKTVLNK